jgi:hypothetical protein
MARIPIITRGCIHLDTIAPIVTIIRSASPAIMRDIACTIKLLQDTEATIVIRARSTKIAATAMIIGMNLDLVDHTNPGHQGSTINHPKIS